MEYKQVTETVWVSPQISEDDISDIAKQGFNSIICNRPDDEAGAIHHQRLAKLAQKQGIAFYYIPVSSFGIADGQPAEMAECLSAAKTPVLAYCRSGNRSSNLTGAAMAERVNAAAASAGHVVIVGGGAAGIATASSLFERSSAIQVTIIEPADVHYYQPGWTMVGAGVFSQEKTVKAMAGQIPNGVKWVKSAVREFKPEQNLVIADNGDEIIYHQLVVCPGLKLDWAAIEGLEDTLGKNGVTSNYRFDLAPYTWKLVSEMKKGKAIFTQPPMPIKCAGAPQKAMYLSADHWQRSRCLDNIEIEFNNAGGVLFGVKEYVPSLMEYVKKYNAEIVYTSNLVAIDGTRKIAKFEQTFENGTKKQVEKTFDMIHICPPQKAHDFIANSPLADEAGWVDVDQTTLQHKRYANIWSLGDAANTPNAKTAAAVRKQAPIVAENLLSVVAGGKAVVGYSGYGSCPLTVERGRIVLAEFSYGGALEPTFPKWLLNGTKPTRLAWFLKENIMPVLYWHGMLKGKEWLAKPLNRVS